MYIPKHYRMNDRNEIFNFIDKNSFAILVTRNNAELMASHLPLLLKRDEGKNGFLYGHMARSNQQWRNAETEVLVIFSGAHKYISSSWYETDQSVPTWNYISVHVNGKIEIIEDRDRKIGIIKEVVEFFEPDPGKYDVINLKPGYFEGLIKGITAFKIEITGAEGKKKLSQNHSEERQRKVINNLETLTDEDSRIIKEEMKKNLHS